MRKLFFMWVVAIVLPWQVVADNDSLLTYINEDKYEVEIYEVPEFSETPKNIILFIADGMGFSQLTAAYTANSGQLYMSQLKHIGLITTHSLDRYVTDSAAGGTALATGNKVNSGNAAMDEDGIPLPTILEISSQHGKATGLISTSSITHATPASFIAHQPSRNMKEAIAADFLETDITVFIGGGLRHFTEREDGRDLTKELRAKGYGVFTSLNDAMGVNSEMLAVLLADRHTPEFGERGEMLSKSTGLAIDRLNRNENGFFMMIEGSQIDWAGHRHNTPYVVGEMLDMDRAVGVALEFAAKNGETLVIVTSDHETGGMAIHNGCFEEGMITAAYTTSGHTGVMVPVMAYGPGAEKFIGIYDNTDVFHKMMKLFGF